MSDFSEPQMKSFSENLDLALKKAMEEKNKKIETAWVRLGSAVNTAGNAKADLNQARQVGADVFDAAQAYRAAEGKAQVALNAIITLIGATPSLTEGNPL